MSTAIIMIIKNIISTVKKKPKQNKTKKQNKKQNKTLLNVHCANYSNVSIHI